MPDQGEEPIETAPPSDSVSFVMSGFDRAEDAQQVANTLWGAIRAISAHINVERLAGVSVASDYVQALAEVDRGVENLNPLARSDNDTMVGVAMAVPVVRDGVLKKHLVFDAELVLPIVMCNPETEAYRTGIYTLAHECAHIADMREIDLAFPNVLLNERVSGVQASIEPLASSLWSEYTACRQSAKFGRKQGAGLIEMAKASCGDGQKVTSEAIAVYRFHRDIGQLLDETLEPATRVVRACAYVVGHLDAFDEEIPDDLKDALVGADLFDLVEEMRDGLRTLWDARGEWKSRDEFAFTSKIILDALAVAGLIVTIHPDDADGGARIDVPFTSKNP